MTIYNQDLRAQYPQDSIAVSVMDCLDGRVSDSLIAEMREGLRGYNEDMQLEIADDLLDCATGIGIHYTGIKPVDMLLQGYYLRIAEEMGINKEEILTKYN